jgi:hypothetical protein
VLTHPPTYKQSNKTNYIISNAIDNAGDEKSPKNNGTDWGCRCQAPRNRRRRRT